MNVVPSPTREETEMSPKCSFTILNTMVSPSPVPKGLVVKYGSKILSMISSGMPVPVSATRSEHLLAVAPRLDAEAPPAGMAATAFLIRLSSACLMKRASMRSSGQLGGEAALDAIPAWSSSGRTNSSSSRDRPR